MKLLPLIDPTNASEIIWSLAKLGFNTKSEKNYILIMKLIEILSCDDSLSSRQVTTCLTGLATMRLQYNFLSITTQKQLVHLISNIKSSISARELSNIFHSLTKMKIPWDSLDSNVQSYMLELIYIHKDSFKQQEGSTLIYSLGLCNICYNDLSIPLQESIYDIAISTFLESEVNSNRFTCQQISNTVYGLMKLGIKYNTLPNRILESMIAAVVKVMDYMNEQEISNIIYSFGMMEARWDELPDHIKNVFTMNAANKFPNLIPQGVSNVVYGMRQMSALWADMPTNYKTNAIIGITNVLTLTAHQSMRGNGQAISNIFYALGYSQVNWNDFDSDFQYLFYQALEKCLHELKGQELGLILYGLGLMKAEYNDIPKSVINQLIFSYANRMSTIGNQDTCSILNGLSKLNAKWINMPDKLKALIFKSIDKAGDNNMEDLCLACCIYSLSSYELNWYEDIPANTQRLINQLIDQNTLSNQILSNILYGLSQMKLLFIDLSKSTQNKIYHYLSLPDAYSTNFPQHIANSLYSLAVMECSYYSLPFDNLEISLINSCPSMNSQETANSVYGLALLDVSWSYLSYETHLALYYTIYNNYATMTIQEISNVMYSFALLMFDCDYNMSYNNLFYKIYNKSITNYDNKRKKSNKTSKMIDDNTTYEQLLVDFHNFINSNPSELSSNDLFISIQLLLIKRFQDYTIIDYKRENFDQFAMYFQTIVTLPEGHDFVKRYLREVPSISGPGAHVPSRLHSQTIQAASTYLSVYPDEFYIFNEFNGLGNGLFPIDAAVYYFDKLIAFIEIDGEFHYKQTMSSGASFGSSTLRRKDKLKEYLYKKKYVGIPIFRIRSDQCAIIGVNRAGFELANWIIGLVGKSKLKSTIDVSIDSN